MLLPASDRLINLGAAKNERCRKIKVFFVKFKSLFSPPDLTCYPYFLGRKIKLSEKQKPEDKSKYSVFYFLKDKEISLNPPKFFLLFFRSAIRANPDKAPVTITRKDNSYSYNKNVFGKKLLVIYVDGLSSFINQKSNMMSKLMPNTNTFFHNATIFENYYGTGEWTLPNYASLMTGKLQNSHGFIFSSKKRSRLKYSAKFPLLHEYLEEIGLNTNVISAVPYVNPNFGFHHGTENFLYAKNLNAKGIIEWYEYFEKKHERNNVTWLHFMDIHHKLRGSDGASSDSNAELVNELVTQFRFAKEDAQNFISRARNLDSNLERLFSLDFTHKYENVILVSDHGSTRLNKEWEKCLDDARTKTTLITRNKRQNGQIYVGDLVNHLSFPKIVMELLGIEHSKIQPKLHEKALLIQAIYEGKRYRARFRDKKVDIDFVGSFVGKKRPFIQENDVYKLISDPKLNHLSRIHKNEIVNELLGNSKTVS